jgi:hypothetical protein
MPYRAASKVLQICGVGDMRASRMAIRRHGLEIGRRVEAGGIFSGQVIIAGAVAAIFSHVEFD